MSIEDDSLSHDGRIINQVGNNEITIIFDPLLSCTPHEVISLMEEARVAISGKFDGPGFTPDALYNGLFGVKQRGKILALSRDLKSECLNALVSGQILNNNGNQMLFNGLRVFHLSLIYSSRGDTLPLWNFLTRGILTEESSKADYFSCFTQDPRVYLLLRYASAAKIYPNHDLRFKSKHFVEIYQQLIDFFNGTDVKNGVFKQKAHGSFTLEKRYSKNPLINNWFYDTLGILPEEGDLLFLMAKIKA